MNNNLDKSIRLLDQIIDIALFEENNKKNKIIKEYDDRALETQLELPLELIEKIQGKSWLIYYLENLKELLTETQNEYYKEIRNRFQS